MRVNFFFAVLCFFFMPLSGFCQPSDVHPFFDALKNENWEKAISNFGPQENLNDIWKDGQLPLHWAVSLGSPEAISFLIDHGADVMMKTQEGESLFHLLAHVDDIPVSTQIARVLIGENVPVDEVEPVFGTTPIFWQNRDVAQLLIDNGADVNWVAKEGYTPLFWQANSDANDVVELLIDSGADVNQTLYDGTTLLHLVCQTENTKLLKLFISSGLDVNARDSFGWTPLHVAAKEQNSQIIQFLLSYGAKKDLKTLKQRDCFQKGMTAYEVGLFLSADNRILTLLKP